MVVDRMSDLRSRGDFLGAMSALLSQRDCDRRPVQQAFRHHFLGMRNQNGHELPCLLLEGAAHGHAQTLLNLVAAIDHHRVESPLLEFLTDDLAHLLESRLELLRAISCDGRSTTIQSHLLNALRLYSGDRPLKTVVNQEQRTHPGQPAFLKQLPTNWASELNAVEAIWRAKTSKRTDPNWDDPALLIVGETLAYLLNHGQLPALVHKVETWVLLAATRHIQNDGETVMMPDGLLGRLVIEKIPEGSGLLYPDCRYSGYLSMDASFQQGLRNAMTVLRQRADWIEQQGHVFDYRWRLIPLSPRDGLPESLAQLSGPSAEAAYACALRASLWNERLDETVALSACFHEPAADHGRLHPVGGIEEKILALRPGMINRELAELRRCRIREIVLHTESLVSLPSEVKVDDWPIHITRVTTFDDAYRRLSDHCRITDHVRRELAARSRQLLDVTCAPHVSSSLSRRRPGDPQKNEPAEVPVPLDDSEVEAILSGNVPAGSRYRILGESGLGKSTILIEAEYRIASSPESNLIPIRLGAGPARCAKDDLGRWIRLPLLSEFDWLKDFSHLLDDMAARLLGELIPDAQVRSQWIRTVVARSEAVFLLDAIDQTDRTISLSNFFAGIGNCQVVLSGRPETRYTKSGSFAGVDWHDHTLWIDPFNKDRIRAFWGETPQLERLLSNHEWEPLRTIPILLHQMRRLAVDGQLNELPNREAVYHRTLKMLVQHGKQRLDDAGHRQMAMDDLPSIVSLLSKIAWETICLESQSEEPSSGRFTGELSDDAYTKFLKQHRDLLVQLDQLNLTARQTYFDEAGDEHLQFSWRHFSFCEWFSGLYLADMTLDDQAKAIKSYGNDDRWFRIIRFALCAAQRNKRTKTVNNLAKCLLGCGKELVLWATIIHDDGITIRNDLDNLRRWLVHRDLNSRVVEFESDTSPWARRAEDPPPALNHETAGILASIFGIDHPEPWTVRDSRWLNAGWQLVLDGMQSQFDVVRLTCERIHESFLTEFEQRVYESAQRNQGKRRQDWHRSDRGLLELVPDDWLVTLNLMPSETLKSIRHWPVGSDEEGQKRTHEQRRDQFNELLKASEANYCLCPPVDWEHPYRNDDGTPRDPHGCLIGGCNDRSLHHLPENLELGRTPVTNRQFEAFDRLHRRSHPMLWRGDEETDANALDDHPVVQVTWYQARMMCVWLTGRGKFGRFSLPFDRDWETCCRAGRDRPGELFGIPWCDENQRPILNANGQEQFDSLSSDGANVDGRFPEGMAARRPDRNWTIPVGKFAANGFGLLDLHGQVWEWTLNLALWDRDGQVWEWLLTPDLWDQKLSDQVLWTDANVSVRGGGVSNTALDSRCSNRGSFAPDDRNYDLGFRLTRTK